MAKVTVRPPKKPGDREVVYAKTRPDIAKTPQSTWKWWNAGSKKDLALQLIETAVYLKQNQVNRMRQASLYSRLYGNQPLMNYIGSGMGYGANMALPVDRPTMNVIQSCTDTLVSRITQARPRPVFLTDNSDYKQRNLGKKMNNFIMGEFYKMKAYEKGELVFRDAGIFGTGVAKLYESADKRVEMDRVLAPELYVDLNDAFYGAPRQLLQLKLVDRQVLLDNFPGQKSLIISAEQAFPDGGGESARSVADQVMVVEGWHLPSGPEATDGEHVIAISGDVLYDEKYERDRFPFGFLHYSNPIVGMWGQGLCEQLIGTQVQINQLLITISQSINLVGVPRVFVEDGSKVVKAQLNNAIGSIVTYSGTKPIYEVAPCIPQEIYAQLERLVTYAYQQSGISALAAVAQKPQGLDSGEAIRSYDDIQSDRFASINKRYDNWYSDLAELNIDMAAEIARRDGKYTTVYPNKDGSKEIDLKKADLLEDDPYVIQCFDASSLPRDPAGRLQKVTEMAQSGMISMQEARRLLDYPDLQQVDRLAFAAEERIYQQLDAIVEDGSYDPPDPFTDLMKANEVVVQYINLYSTCKLEEEKMQMLRDYFTRIQALKAAAQPPAPAGAPGASPQAVPQAPPSSPLLPNAPQPAA